MNRVAALDGLRALAVLAVMCFHSGFAVLGRGGFWGVDVFFVLSGFLITGVLLGERETTGHVSLGRFYARRALRLYPPLLALVIVLTPLGPSLADGMANWLDSSLLAVTYTTDLTGYLPFLPQPADNPLGQTWSLAVEEQFYLLWAPLFVLAGFGLSRLRGLRAVAITLGLAAALVVLVLLTRGGSDPDVASSVYGRPDLRFAQLLCGAALAFLLDRRTVRASLSRALTPLSLLAVVAIWLTTRAVPLPFDDPVGHFVAWTLVLTLATAVVIARLVTDERAVLSRILAFPLLTAIGLRSYALYLWHFPLFALIQPEVLGHAVSRNVEALLEWVATFVAAELSLRLVERPAWRLKSRLRTTPVAGIEITAPPLAATGHGH